MRMLLLFLSCFFCAFVLSGADDFYGQKFIAYRISTGSTPVIDGAVGEKEWQDAAVLPPFYVVNAFMDVDQTPRQMMMKFDDENLYIGFVCRMEFDLDMQKIPHDKYELFKVESYEFIFRPRHGQERSLRFGVERAGGTYDQRFYSWTDEKVSSWEPEWKYACKTTWKDFFVSGEWQGEIAIPWQVLGMTPPKEGETVTLPFNVIHYRGNTKMGNFSGSRFCSLVPVTHIWEVKKHTQLGRLFLMRNRPVLRHVASENYSSGVGALNADFSRQDNFSAHFAVWRKKDGKFYHDETKKGTGNSVGYRKVLDMKEKTAVLGFWEVRDDDGLVAKHWIDTTIKPLFYAETQWLSGNDEVVCIADSIPAQKKAEKLVVRLTDGQGRVYAEKTQIVPAKQKWFEERISAAEIPDKTDFLVEISLAGRTFTQKLKKEFPLWQSGVGRVVTAPPPPWEPLSITENEKNVSLGILDHAYHFGDILLPEITLHGRAFQAGKWQFQVETAGGVQTFVPIKRCTVREKDGRGATLEYEAKAADVTLKGKIRVEFDGLAWFDISLTPHKKALKIRKIELVCPMDATQLRYMSGFGMNAPIQSVHVRSLIGGARTKRPIPLPNIANRPELSFDGWKFGRLFHNFYWIGGEDRGVYFILPSKENLAIRKNYTSTVDDGGKNFTFFLHLVDHEIVVEKPLEYHFGLIVTPAKRLPHAKKLRRIGQFYSTPAWNKENFTRGNVISEQALSKVPKERLMGKFPVTLPPGYSYTAILPHWLLPRIQIGTALANDKEKEMIANHARGISASGIHPMLWYDPLVTTFGIPQTMPYMDDWETIPKTRLPIETFATIICPKSSFPHYYFYGFSERMKQGIECFYFDMAGINPCANRLHGCGWRDAKGNVFPAIPFLAYREYFLQMQKLLKEKNPKNLLVIHGGFLLDLWCDVRIYGEEWSIADNYLDLSPEFYQLQKLSTSQCGTYSVNFPALLYVNYPKALKETTQNECWGLALLHNETNYNCHPYELAGNFMVTDILEKFGADESDCTFVPYWRNPLSPYPEKPLLVSSFQRNGRELMVVFNQSVSETAWTLPGPGEFVDHLTGEVYQGKIPMPGRTFRLLQAKEKEGKK